MTTRILYLGLWKACIDMGKLQDESPAAFCYFYLYKSIRYNNIAHIFLIQPFLDEQ